mmetsp:Transcript_24126/g.59031  ORF Transcript_24126/g.59031 Transcript_24126/m.59031 type:complete len:195 (+) Transcript_24126:410-994(+)|eukprot:CAMPEP_0113642264 /NCGR_PEP_ID=MMETSP0017_2-20120614/22201_1 /TAXON_ID=2856 /ORGANISM="Cylindrotheca closterium" /LENGTH=194 /DNA_ID=CAMNT_0000553675 /DNA_START=355 /DNA_END=939 /DNA_ORIENTATION=- /assembly_acc=CAM_ASM_000147
MVAASAIPGRVPLGFICGYPVPSGEQYGGSMFARSAANDTLQGKAIHAINEKWGEGKWNGRETIGIPVCKKKYAPFAFRKKNGKFVVERMFGCKCHSELRKERIETHGVRDGWEPFGQWSLQKAQDIAKRGSDKVNGTGTGTTKVEKEAAVVSSDEELKSICSNGRCAWKMKTKFDNIRREVTGVESSDEEEYY